LVRLVDAAVAERLGGVDGGRSEWASHDQLGECWWRACLLNMNLSAPVLRRGAADADMPGADVVREKTSSHGTRHVVGAAGVSHQLRLNLVPL
jgi:hypothetical protein